MARDARIRVSRRIVGHNGLVEPSRDDAVSDDEHGADGNFAGGKCQARLAQRGLHEHFARHGSTLSRGSEIRR